MMRSLVQQKTSTRRNRTQRNAPAESLQIDPEAVRHWRMKRGFTQEALAKQRVRLDGEMHSISCTQIRRIEAEGRCGPTSVRILAALLEVSISELLPRKLRHHPCGLPREGSADFVGRESQLEQLLALLLLPDSAGAAISLEGPPGVGKTELALRICAICAQQHAFRILWFDARDSDLSCVWADVVAPHLGIVHSSPAERIKLAVEAIEALGEPVLIVLDGLSEWSPSSPAPRPRGAHVRWLVTTRTRDLGDRALHHLDVPLLDPRASREFLIRLAGEEVSRRPEFAELVDELEGYTVAVEVAGSVLRRFRAVDPKEYLARLRAGELDELTCEVEFRTLYGRSLQVSLWDLWERIGAPGRRSWQIAACFGPYSASPHLADACGISRADRAALRDHHLIEEELSGRWRMCSTMRRFGSTAGSAEDLRAARQAFIAGCIEYARNLARTSGSKARSCDRVHLDAALGWARVLGRVDIDDLTRAVTRLDSAEARRLETVIGAKNPWPLGTVTIGTPEALSRVVGEEAKLDRVRSR